MNEEKEEQNNNKEKEPLMSSNLPFKEKNVNEWTSELTGKYKNILSLRPLTRIKDTFMNTPGLKELYELYDPLAIALLMIDKVIVEMVPYSGITVEELFQKVVPFFKRMDKIKENKDIDKNDYNLVFQKILDLLTFQSQKSKYKEVYTDYAPEIPVQRIRSSRILIFKTFQKSVLWATDETVNIYLQLLDVDIADRQMANNLILQRQIDKKQFDKALGTAKRNLTLTNHYSIRMEQIIQTTRRDLSRQDWDKKIPKELNDAKDHISNVLRDIRLQKNRLQNLENSTYDKYEFETLRDLVKTIELTISMLLPLQSKIYDTNDEFLAKQWIYLLHNDMQRFINLEKDLFRKLLHSTCKEAADLLDNCFPYFSQPKSPHIITYSQILRKLMEGIKLKKKKRIKSIDRENLIKLKKIGLVKFNPDLIKEAENVFENFLKQNKSFTFNQLIKRLNKESRKFEVKNYLRIKLQIDLIREKAIENLFKNIGYKVSLIPEGLDNSLLDNNVFYGNNLLIERYK